MAFISVPSNLYPYIYSFLIENSLKKTAKTFLKEIQLAIPSTVEGPTLLEVFDHYVKHVNSSKKSFGTVVDSPARGKKRKNNDKEELLAPASKIAKKSNKATKDVSPVKEKKESKKVDQSKKTKKSAKPVKQPSPSSSSSDSENEMEFEPPQPVKKVKELVAKKEDSSSSSSDDDEEEEKEVKKAESDDDTTSSSEEEETPKISSKKDAKTVSPLTPMLELMKVKIKPSNTKNTTTTVDSSKTKQKTKVADPQEKSSSSSEEEEEEIPVKQPSETTSSDEESSEEENVVSVKNSKSSQLESLSSASEKNKKKVNTKKSGKVQESSSDSDETSDDEDSEDKTKPSQSSKISRVVKAVEKDSSDDSSSDDEESSEEETKTVVKKEKKITQSTPAPPITTPTPSSSKKEKKKKGDQSQGSTPFRRISETIKVDSRLSNNSFEAKRGSKGSWGEKANKDLKHTKVPVLKPEVRKPLTHIVSEANKKVAATLLNKEPRLPPKGLTQTLEIRSSDLPDPLQSKGHTETIKIQRKYKKGPTQTTIQIIWSDLPDPLQSSGEEEDNLERCTLEEELYNEYYEETDEEDFDGCELEEIKEPVNHTVNKAEERRYPKRRVEEIKYTEVELSDEDEYLFCEDCEEIDHGDSPVQGPLLTLDSSTGYDEESTKYTSVPVPKELTVKPSSIPNAGLGVFATQPIPKGVRFGPYKGRKVYRDDIDEGEDTSYMWEVKRGSESYFIDGQVESERNWMRIIKCARDEEEQNLVAFQYHGEIYYRSFKCIYPGNELFVWYGDQCAKELGISTAFEKDDDSQAFVCINCGSSFVAQSSFNLHLCHNKSCFDANPQIFSCLQCGESFARLHLLQNHIRKHEEEKLNANTKIIESIHVNESFEDYGKTCPDCGKGFTTNGELERHIRTHTGDKPIKPYKCHYCDKGFSRKDSLKRHIRTHTGDKPYKCQYCDKGFSREDSLKRHVRTHTGYEQ